MTALRKVTAERLEELAFDNRQPVDVDGDFAYVTVGAVTYQAPVGSES